MTSEAAIPQTALSNHPSKGPWRRWTDFLAAPVNGTSLAVFRMWFALCMLANTWVYTIDVHIDYMQPRLFYSFIPGMPIWPGNGIYVHFGIMAISAAMIGLGLYYRVATIIFFLAHTYLFLLEKAYYQNHFYLVFLLSFLFIFLPANEVWSIDNDRKVRPNLVPRWSVLILKLQIAIVYFYGGIAKLNTDWLGGHPQTEFLGQFSHEPLIGPIVSHPWFAYLVTYGGIAIDLSLGFLLFWGPTFWIGAIIATAFHVMNSRLFPIGIFPWLMIGTIGLFAPYDWPERIKSKFVAWPGKQKRTETNSGAPTNSDAEKDSDAETNSAVETNSEKDSTTVLKTSAAMLIFLHLYLIMQLVIPLRRFLYPGETSWTELGHRFSWSMMLRTKLIQSFDATIVNPQTNQQIHVNLSKHMSPKQVFHMQTRPDMILRYAHYIADVEEKKLGVRPKVFIRAIESLNLRPVQDLIDPNVDLAKEQDTLMAPRWIIPLNPTLTLGPQKRVITNTDHDRPMTDTP